MVIAIVVLSILLLGCVIYIFTLDRSFNKTLEEARNIYHESIEQIKREYHDSHVKLVERYERGRM